MGWMYFGFLNAIYGDKKRAVELLDKLKDFAKPNLPE